MRLTLAPYKPKLPPKLEKAGGGGGGGMKQPEPLSKGTTPKFAPEAVHAADAGDHAEATELPVAPTITAEAPKIDMDQYGDPNSKNLPFSGGPGIEWPWFRTRRRYRQRRWQRIR